MIYKQFPFRKSLFSEQLVESNQVFLQVASRVAERRKT